LQELADNFYVLFEGLRAESHATLRILFLFGFVSPVAVISESHSIAQHALSYLTVFPGSDIVASDIAAGLILLHGRQRAALAKARRIKVKPCFFFFFFLRACIVETERE
jgi:hypothetical protein